MGVEMDATHIGMFFIIFAIGFFLGAGAVLEGMGEAR